MNKKIIIILFLLVFLSLPFFASAQTTGPFNYVPLEKIPGSDKETSQAIDFYTYVSAIYKFGIWAVGIVALFMLVFGGYTYITSAGNNSSMETAKKIITDAIVGVIMALTAYLLLFAINPDLVKMKKLAPVAGISGTGTGATTTGATGAPSGVGKCVPLTTGPCSVDNLKSSCFGATNAEKASAICNAESVGDPRALSISDKCKKGQSFSVGLFQINLTVHDIGNGCTSAFSGKNYACSVTDQNKYDQCVSLAQDSTKNIQEACAIFKASGWNAWGANTDPVKGCHF
ncbi:MAG: hypothetical protein WC608_03610 [Parcubacteria group bacterium]